MLHLRVWLQTPAPIIFRAITVANFDIDVPQVYRRLGKIKLPQLADNEMSQSEGNSQLQNKHKNIAIPLRVDAARARLD
jgi:hypothetical protein